MRIRWIALSLAALLVLGMHVSNKVSDRDGEKKHLADAAAAQQAVDAQKAEADRARMQVAVSDLERKRIEQLHDWNATDVRVGSHNWAYSGARVHVTSEGKSQTFILPALRSKGGHVSSTFRQIVSDRGFRVAVTGANGEPLANFHHDATDLAIYHIVEVNLEISGFDLVPYLTATGANGETLSLWSDRNEPSGPKSYRDFGHRVYTGNIAP